MKRDQIWRCLLIRNYNRRRLAIALVRFGGVAILSCRVIRKKLKLYDYIDAYKIDKL